MTTQAPSPESRWNRYYRGTADRPPHGTLLRALELFAAEGRGPGFAIDLGCGAGRDSLELLRRGWRVLGIDAEPRAFATLWAREELPPEAALETRLARFESLTRLPAADLVNSGFALPFCAAEAFPALWAAIRACLPPGGRFSGHLLGPRDSWAATCVTVGDAELASLLDGFAAEWHEVEECDGTTPAGDPKHWHIHHLVLRRTA